jgi:protease PrsW
MSLPIPPPPPDPEERRAMVRRGCACGCVGCGGLFFLAMMGLVPVALTVAAIAAVLPVPTYIFLILLLDRYEREPWTALAAAFLWGALVATFIALIFNELVGAVVTASMGEQLGNVLTSSAVAPVVEEAAKGSAVLILYFVLRHEFDNVLDGIVYGSLVGLGFAMTENILYFGHSYLEEGLVGVGILFYFRVVLGGLGHALYTGTTGAAIGLARELQRGWVRWLIVPLGYMLAVLQHASWNFIAATVVPAILPEDTNPLVFLLVVMPFTTFVLTAPGLVTLLIVATLARRREANVIREFLRDEVERGTLTPDEYQRLPVLRQRTSAEYSTLRRRGLLAFFAMRDLHQAATELAFRKWHLSRGERPKRAQRRTPEDRYRDQIAYLRRRLA